MARTTPNANADNLAKSNHQSPSPFWRSDAWRLAGLLLLLVSLAATGIALLGERLLQYQPAEAWMQQRKAAARELGKLDRQVAEILSEIAEYGKQRLERAVGGTAGGNTLLVLDEMVELAVTYAPNGQRLYPPNSGALFVPVQRYLLTIASSALMSARTALNKKEQSGGSWRLFAGPSGLTPLHCWHSAAETTSCATFNRTHVIEQVVEHLDASADTKKSYNLALYDSIGGLIWPRADNGLPTSQAPIVVQSLSGPFTAWRAEARLAPGAPVDTKSLLALALVTIALLIGIGSLAWIVFRTQKARLDESCRRISDAAHFSHDLRTPLTNLRLYGTLIRQRATNDPRI